MHERDVLITEVVSALTIMSLLLIFLPLYIQAFREELAAHESRPRRSRDVTVRRLSVVWALLVLTAALVGLGAADATCGLLTLWDVRDFSREAALLLLTLIWLVVFLTVATLWHALSYARREA